MILNYVAIDTFKKPITPRTFSVRADTSKQPTQNACVSRTAYFNVLILHCYARSTLEHYVRVRSKSRVPGGSLGRSFSRSCGGLTVPPPVNRDPLNADSRRTSIRVSNFHLMFVLLWQMHIPLNMIQKIVIAYNKQ